MNWNKNGDSNCSMNSKRLKTGGKLLMVSFLSVLVGVATQAHAEKYKKPVCLKTAKLAHKASKMEIRDDFFIGYGKCINVSDAAKRKECYSTVKEELKEAQVLIKDQFSARKEVCAALGNSPYDPQIDPDEFIDFEAVISGAEDFTPNPYFPLHPGMTSLYTVTDDEGSTLEEIKVEILTETKEILGVNCIVVRDRVWEIDDEGEKKLIEDTHDWYAQDVSGNVWYFGEIAINYEDGELSDLEGSWTSGEEYDTPGYIMKANAQVGEVYRQEFSLGNAEDMAEIIEYLDDLAVQGTTYSDVLKTMDYTPVDPGTIEFKYYAPGIGVILEENPIDGERMELQQISFK